MGFQEWERKCHRLKNDTGNPSSTVGAEVTRLQMLWKSRGLAVEEVSLLTSAPTFQTRSWPSGGVETRKRLSGL
jgi:hypothetical protein